MSKEYEIVRLYYEGLTQREICTALSCGHDRVSRVLKAAKAAGVDREAAETLGDSGIRELLPPIDRTEEPNRAAPDFERLTRELERPGVTRKLLWYEYCNDLGGTDLQPYRYSQFCKLFDEHLRVTNSRMRITHKPGQRLFIDWAGRPGEVTIAATGQVLPAYVFVTCMPYSSLIYAEAFPDMKQGSWTLAHIHSFEYMGGVPSILVPDNCATATNRSSVCVTLVNESYQQLAEHYGCAVVPARVRRPNDKALVEGAVSIVERQVLAALRNERFFSFEELNEAISIKVDAINGAPFQAKGATRRQIFDEEEAPLLKSLPANRFELYEFKRAKVAADYHVCVDGMRYSVPFAYISQTLDVRLTSSRVDVFRKGEKVATHKRLCGRKGQYDTLREHMPEKHRCADIDWTPARFTRWASGVGPACESLIGDVLDSKAIVEQAFVPCMNILGLAKRGRGSLLEAACAKLNEQGHKAPTYSLVKNTMAAIKAQKKSFDDINAARNGQTDNLGDAGCVRGADYYRMGGE